MPLTVTGTLHPSETRSRIRGGLTYFAPLAGQAVGLALTGGNVDAQMFASVLAAAQ